NKTLAHPASVDSIPSSANQEDHVSMGTIAARHAGSINQNTRRVLAIECICALQAADYQGVGKMSPKLQAKWRELRRIVPRITKDRGFSKDIECVNRYLHPFFNHESQRSKKTGNYDQMNMERFVLIPLAKSTPIARYRQHKILVIDRFVARIAAIIARLNMPR